jgi:hypothetical protein
MRTYRISEEKARAETPAAIQRSVYISLSAVLAGVFIGGRATFVEGRSDLPWFWLGSLGLMITGLVFYWVSKTSRSLADAYSSFELTVDQVSLTKKQKNTPDVTLLRSQVKRIEEHEGKGFRICTDDRNVNIWVPVELEDYEVLKADLLSVPVGYGREKSSWLRSYCWVAALLALFLIQGLAHNRFVASAAAFSISAWLFRGFYVHYRNPNLTKKGRRNIFFACWVGVALLVRGILLLRG